MLKIDIQICFTAIPPMQNFIEIHQRNPELLSSGGFRAPPPRLDRGIERPRLDGVNGSGQRAFCNSALRLIFECGFEHTSSVQFTILRFIGHLALSYKPFGIKSHMSAVRSLHFVNCFVSSLENKHKVQFVQCRIKRLSGTS